MFHSKIISVLFRFPLRIWQEYIIRHVENCASCQRTLASKEGVRGLLVQESEAGRIEHLWPVIKKELRKKERRGIIRPVFPKPWLKWVAASASLLVLAAVSFWVYRSIAPRKIRAKEELSERFQINYLRIESEPAHAFLFQPRDSDVIIIWAEKNI